MEGEDIRRFGPKAITSVTITRNSCIKYLTDNYVFVASGKKGIVLDGLKNQPVSIGMHGEYKQHMYEVYIPAKQDISVGYHYLFQLNLSQSVSTTKCYRCMNGCWAGSELLSHNPHSLQTALNIAKIGCDAGERRACMNGATIASEMHQGENEYKLYTQACIINEAEDCLEGQRLASEKFVQPALEESRC